MGIAKTTWWLMCSSFPSLNWARLRESTDGKADILDIDGRLLSFDSLEEAKLELLEDEFRLFENLDDDDYREIGLPIGELVPPVAETDAELVQLMYVRRH